LHKPAYFSRKRFVNSQATGIAVEIFFEGSVYIASEFTSMAEHNELGTRGENAAVEFLQQNGHEILARNYKHGKVEIDIVSKEESLTVFSEVKTRSTDYFGYPEESVDKKKRKKIKRAAEEYMFENNLETEVRFDIISITTTNGNLKIYHIKDAFFNEMELDDDRSETW